MRLWRWGDQPAELLKAAEGYRPGCPTDIWTLLYFADEGVRAASESSAARYPVRGVVALTQFIDPRVRRDVDREGSQVAVTS